MRMVNVKGESAVNGGKCTTEKISPRPRTVTCSIMSLKDTYVEVVDIL